MSSVTFFLGDSQFPVAMASVTSGVRVTRVVGPDPTSPTVGARGFGETSSTGVTAAISNAVHHATGRRIRELPITPEKLLAGCRSASLLRYYGPKPVALPNVPLGRVTAAHPA